MPGQCLPFWSDLELKRNHAAENVGHRVRASPGYGVPSILERNTDEIDKSAHTIYITFFDPGRLHSGPATDHLRAASDNQDTRGPNHKYSYGYIDIYSCPEHCHTGSFTGSDDLTGTYGYSLTCPYCYV